ncbi:hypothetical protein [Corallibacter sp.]|uniref:hypothetical protein n=1 Tax=Corallibacter sp. TaxID=2038084 RepID=UPI003AB17930
MQIKGTYLFILCLMFLSSFFVVQQQESVKDIKLLTTKTQFDVGNVISLKFSGNETSTPLLYCSSSYGSTLISSAITDNTLAYTIPEAISNKTGVVNWKLVNDSTLLSGKFNINPKAEVATMETYIGPPSIEAGGTDYTMLVVIPTDSLDNPVPSNTQVNAKHQFLASEDTSAIFTNNLIAYKNIYSKTEHGRMLISSESLGTNSKEFTINVTAAIPSNFNIYSKRPHDYADGNQITTFSTSIIKDRFNNTVSDGTFVTFIITNSQGNILKTSGTTIDGVASAKMIHPDYSDNWVVKAFIDGMAESDEITINYKQAINDFDVTFSKNNRNINVGPLQSFMQQMIPDGLQVTLHIYKNNALIQSEIKTSYNGFVSFNINENIYLKGQYDFTVIAAGIEKNFKNKTLW